MGQDNLSLAPQTFAKASMNNVRAEIEPPCDAISALSQQIRIELRGELVDINSPSIARRSIYWILLLMGCILR